MYEDENVVKLLGNTDQTALSPEYKTKMEDQAISALKTLGIIEHREDFDNIKKLMEKKNTVPVDEKICFREHWDSEECECNITDYNNYMHICTKESDEQGNCQCYSDDDNITFTMTTGTTDGTDTEYIIWDGTFPDFDDPIKDVDDLGEKEVPKYSLEEEINKLKDNPWEEITIKPEYYGVDRACIDFAIGLLSGFVWEVENTNHFMTFHPDLSRIKELLYRFTWLKNNQGDAEGNGSTYWPNSDEMIQLAFVEFAMMIPKLWD